MLKKRQERVCLRSFYRHNCDFYLELEVELEDVVAGFCSCGYLQNGGFVECIVQSYSIIFSRALLG